MAKKSNRSNNNTSTRTTSSPLRIQKEINSDYVELGRDYKKLGLSLWRKPATKYVLGGVGLAVVTPYLLKAIKKIPFGSFFDSSVTEVKNKWNEMTSSDSDDASAH